MEVVIFLKKECNINYYNSSLLTINLDEYVNGCVAQEIGNAAIEACKAQAIAARTNAYYYAVRDKTITDQSSSFQAFTAPRIANKNYMNAYQASQETAGLVLAYNNKPLYPASFSASNGGKVVSSKERWGGDKPWLLSFDDPYDVGDKTGHGVGMSQRGAKTMAALGFTYQEILSFYYPGTTIIRVYGEKEKTMAKTKAQAVVDYCESRIGSGYIWGTSGQMCTQALIEQQKKAYPEYVDENVVKKWIGKQVYDCAGFTRMAMLNAAGIKIVSGATSQWNKTNWAQKGTIDSLPKDKVCLLYRWNGSNMQHTGVYCGNGYFIDARGSNTGVVKNKLGTYSWTHWGIPEGLEQQSSKPAEVLKVLYKATVFAESGSTVNMRAEPDTNSNKVARVAIGQEVEVLEETNSSWAKVLWNEQTGYMMRSYLATDATAPSKEESWYVRIKCDSQKQAEQIAQILGRAEVSA